MDKITDWIKEFTGLSPGVQTKIFTSLIVIIILWLIRIIVIRIVWRKTEDPYSRYRWRKSTIYSVVVVGLLIVGRIWFAGVQSIATFLGLLTAGLAIALQDVVKSVAGWIFVMWRKPFIIGDRIQVGSYAGDVIDLRLFKFSLVEIGNWVEADQSTGRVIHLPNSLILTDVIANYTRGFEFIWNEIPVLVTFESNWQKAKKILAEIAQKHAAHITKDAEKRIKEASKRYLIFFTALTPTVYTSVRDCGVLLTIRYLISPRGRRGSEQAIWEEILAEFSKCKDIDFAYPTQRFYDNVIEGKEDARAEINTTTARKRNKQKRQPGVIE
jgi:small-conductance mechanosensitive channel